VQKRNVCDGLSIVFFVHTLFKNIIYSADPSDRTWNFTLEDYDVLMKKLQCLKGTVSVTGLPDYVLKVTKNSRKFVLVDWRNFMSLNMELLFSLTIKTALDMMSFISSF
jgi:hypothetical protein